MLSAHLQTLENLQVKYIYQLAYSKVFISPVYLTCQYRCKIILPTILDIE